MSATAVGLGITAAWTIQESRAGGNAKQGPATITAVAPLTTTVDNEPVPLSYSIASAGTQTVDLRALTNPLLTTITYAKIRGILVKVTGSAIKIEPGATNDINWFLKGTAPELHLEPEASPGTGPAAFALFFNAVETVDATHRNLKITNTGAGTATVTIVLFGGT